MLRLGFNTKFSHFCTTDFPIGKSAACLHAQIIHKTVVSNSAPNEHRNKKQTKTIKDRTEKAEIKMDIPKRKSNEKTLEKLNEKYANDPKFREEKRKIYRERYQNDSEYREKTLERSKSRYHNDPEYRKATIERAKERYRKNKSK